MKKRIIYVIIIIFIIYQGWNIYHTNKLKSQLVFSQNNISKISIGDGKKTLSYDYEFSPQITKEINNQFANCRKKVVNNLSPNISDNKVCINIFLDGTVEWYDENNGTYKAAKREISIIPKDNKSVYASITIRSENDKNYECKLFLIESTWLSQYLVEVARELKK